MTLVEKATEDFKKGFQDVYDRENAEAGYLNQDDFDSCLARAKEGIRQASAKAEINLAYAIALHREKEHGENTADEQAALRSAGADPEMETRGFWT